MQDCTNEAARSKGINGLLLLEGKSLKKKLDRGVSTASPFVKKPRCFNAKFGIPYGCRLEPDDSLAEGCSKAEGFRDTRA
jgi:hypothetical protein